jgi:hypothetical protein
MTHKPFRAVQIVDLPMDSGKGDQSAGSWRPLGQTLVRIVCPECWVTASNYAIKRIDTTNVLLVKCPCGFNKPCRLLDYGLSSNK